MIECDDVISTHLLTKYLCSVCINQSLSIAFDTLKHKTIMTKIQSFQYMYDELSVFSQFYFLCFMNYYLFMKGIFLF